MGWTDANAPVWALVSGHPTSIRRGRILVFLQAFVDESACDSGDKRLFMAGYLQRADVWAEFAVHWEAALHESPRIEFLHMVEANNLRGEFAGWSERKRDSKLLKLASVIRKFDFVSFEFSIPQKAYFDTLTPVSPRGLNPHFSCVLLTIFSVGRMLNENKVDMPVEFIFDRKDGTEQDIDLFYEFCVESLSDDVKKIIKKPKFEDDDNLYPLQAADMLAWHVRRNYERPGPFIKKISSMISGKYIIAADYPVSKIIGNANSFAAMPIPKPQTKGEWQRFRKMALELKAAGYKPPKTDDILEQVKHFQKFIDISSSEPLE